MAYQHFYSCVPARISMYNRIDSFDTFAHSSALERDFIQGELSAIYADKMRNHEIGRIRRGEIPTVYTQAMLRPGVTVQSALTYLPLDFTGERSAYFVHSLAISEEERSLVFANKDARPFNPQMLMTDIRPFNIVSPTAAPNPAFPDCRYIPLPMNDAMQVIGQYHPEVINYFVFSLLSALCGKGGEVVFRLPCDDRQASLVALELINAVMSILPYHMREYLSFVSFAGHYDQYPGFLLKCVSRSCLRMPVEKGVFFDFERGSVSGLTENIEKYRPLLNFMYSLFGNKQVRDEFHMYIARIVATYPELIIDVDILDELVFLFFCCSGFYTEESVLPNDDVLLKALDSYEKYRAALIDEHRGHLYRSLGRYPREHRAIPVDIFDRISRLYPGETPAAKAVCLESLLNLIHTDVMRGRLFKLIRENFATELDEVKPVIVSHFAGVFYGGFLQSDILGFFDAIFDPEPEDTQSLILDKLLLSIRTPAVQNSVVAFIDRHYDSLSLSHRSKLYTTYLEMLPECDRLSALLIALVNKHIVKEPEQLKDLLYKRTAAFLDADYAVYRRGLLPLLVEKSGFNEDIALKFIITERAGSEMYHHYAALLTGYSAASRATRLLRAYKLAGEDLRPVCDGLVSALSGVQSQLGDTTLYDILRLEHPLSSLNKSSADLLRRVIIYPHAPSTFYDVFKIRYGKNGIERLLKYVKDNPDLASSSQYAEVLDYIKLSKLAEAEDIPGMFEIAFRLPRSQDVRRDIAEHIRMCSLNRNTQGYKTSFAYELLINYLKLDSFRFDTAYSQYKKIFLEEWESELGVKATAERLEARSAADAITLVLECALEISTVVADYYELLEEQSGLGKSIEGFIDSYGIGSARFMKKCLGEAPSEFNEKINELVKERNSRLDGVRGVVDLVGQSLKR